MPDRIYSSARKQDGHWWARGRSNGTDRTLPERVPYASDPWTFATGPGTYLVLTKDGALWTWGERIGSQPSRARIWFQNMLAPVVNRWPSVGRFFPPYVYPSQPKVDKAPYRLWELPAEVRRYLTTNAPAGRVRQ